MHPTDGCHSQCVLALQNCAHFAYVLSPLHIVLALPTLLAFLPNKGSRLRSRTIVNMVAREGGARKREKKKKGKRALARGHALRANSPSHHHAQPTLAGRRHQAADSVDSNPCCRWASLPSSFFPRLFPPSHCRWRLSFASSSRRIMRCARVVIVAGAGTYNTPGTT